MWKQRVSLVNAQVVTEDGIAGSLRFSSGVLAIDGPPRAGDLVIDLEGAFVLPGLINAHDHLELNHYGLQKSRERYHNASEWIADMRPRLRADPAIVEGQRHPLATRLFIGGLKNLLAGTTTVAHHNPLYREMRRACPVRVVRRYGWAHSFLLQDEPAGAGGEPGGAIVDRYRATPSDAPFFLHLAEGFDEAARTEFAALKALGCVEPNLVLIHGVALSGEEWAHLVDRGGGLVWCPHSNEFLFGRSAPIGELLAATPESASHVALGTDSRLSGSRDLLDEIKVALRVSQLRPDLVFPMVTTNAARLLRVGEAGRIAIGLPADLIVIPRLAEHPACALAAVRRADISLVTIGGRPMVAAPEFWKLFEARHTPWSIARVDDVQKIVGSELARKLARYTIKEPGVSVGQPA